MNFKAVPSGFLSEDFVGPSEPLSDSSGSTTVFIGNLLYQFTGRLKTSPLEVNSTEILLGDDTMFIKIHGPGNESSQFLTVHSKFIDQCIDFCHFFIAEHDVRGEAPHVIMPKITAKSPVFVMFEEWNKTSSSAAWATVCPDMILQLVFIVLALFGDLMISQVVIFDTLTRITLKI